MEDLKTIYKIYKADEYLKEGSIVLDLGCGDGEFADWAESKGARVFRIDIRGGFRVLPIAVGRVNGLGMADGEGTGTHILYEAGNTPILTLQVILDFLGPIDVIKCDIEGSEYEIFYGTKLESIKFLTIEFHAWTQPGEPEVEGLGIRTGEMPKDGFDKLVAWLSKTHDIKIEGKKEAGGYIYATLKNQFQ